jgi:hypothetical protein
MGKGQCYETYCDFSKSSYHQQADGKNRIPIASFMFDVKLMLCKGDFALCGVV